MTYIATFDIGTTAVKGVLLDRDGNCVREKSETLETVFEGTFKEQRPGDWYNAFCAVARSFFSSGIAPDCVCGIIMSGQMQDLIVVNSALKPVCNAILYSDGRAQAQAGKIIELIGAETIAATTGNQFDGSMPFAKLLWLKENRPECYKEAEKILISSKDYVIARLTGEFVSDVTSCSTAGMMDIRKKQWNTVWLQAAGLNCGLLPEIRYAHEQAGTVTALAASECGFAAGTPVYAGTGDAGATTLASGISAAGEFNINLGTSGWVACVSRDVLANAGVFNLAAMPEEVYINVVPFLNAGNVHKWICKTLVPDDNQTEKYGYVDALLAKSEAGSHGAMFLPYLVGERFPVMDAGIKGGFVGITPETTKQDLARSALEGVAFSIRQGIESIGHVPKKISIIGGGARTTEWCQILADVLGFPVHVYRNAEYLPAVAIASAVLIAQGKIVDYKMFTDSLNQSENCICYKPNSDHVRCYNDLYPRYLKLYPVLRQLTTA